MAQSYKVFINNFFILITNNFFFTQTSTYDDSLLSIYFHSYAKMILYLKENNYNLDCNIVMCSENTCSVLNKLKLDFNYIIASGGIVKNRDNQLLMIHKNGIWDLPKGKLELNESPWEAAIREVSEETNVYNLEYLSSAPNTYHIYMLLNNDIPVLKETKWFCMTVSDPVFILPQISEGIDLVEWVHFKNLSSKRIHMSIRNLILDFI